MNEEEYLNSRVDSQLEWYSKKSRLNKMWYIRLKVIETVMALLIPFLTAYITQNTVTLKITVGLLGVLVALASNLIILFNVHENWLQYRTTLEAMKYEKFMFLTKTGAYLNNENAFNMFVEKFEFIISKENANWAANGRKESPAPIKSSINSA